MKIYSIKRFRQKSALKKKIGVQLYSVRDQMQEDWEGTLRSIAAMGYDGVEPAGVPGGDAKAFSALLRELKLEVPSAHCNLPRGDHREKVLEEARAMGTQRLISGRGDRDFATVDSIRSVAEIFNEASAAAKEAGMVVGMHNHWWEFEPVEGDGRLGYEILLDYLSPEVFFQIDTYWVAVAGQKPAEVVKKLGDRVLELHIKDGPLLKDEPMLAAGKGKMNFPPIVEEAASSDWLIVELDRCATDMLEAVEESYQYLAKTF